MIALAEGATLKVWPLAVIAGPPGVIVWEPTTMFEEGPWETVTLPMTAIGEEGLLGGRFVLEEAGSLGTIGVEDTGCCGPTGAALLDGGGGLGDGLGGSGDGVGVGVGSFGIGVGVGDANTGAGV